MTERPPALARMAAEVGVIVMGVLVALFAESAWQERQERAEEREILEWISADLTEDSTTLVVDRQWIEMVVPAALESRDILAGRDTLSSVARLAVLYAASTIRTNSNPIRTWDDLSASGRISLIRDAELRRALIDFYGRLAELRADQEALPTDFRTTIIAIFPTEFARGVLRDCIRSPDGRETGPRPDVHAALRSCEVMPSEDPYQLLERLRETPGLERALSELTYDLTGGEEFLTGTEASFTELRARLEEVRSR